MEETVLEDSEHFSICHTGADPEFGKRGGTLLKKVEEQKNKKGHNNNS